MSLVVDGWMRFWRTFELPLPVGFGFVIAIVVFEQLAALLGFMIRQGLGWVF